MESHASNTLVRAQEVARSANVQQSPNGLRFATFGETGVTAPDLDHMLGAVPTGISRSLHASTWFFVPLALREPESAGSPRNQKSEAAMVAPAYSEELNDSAICHRNVELGGGHRGVFISTRLMSDRFALCFEFFINVAHSLVDAAGVPDRFRALVWQQALDTASGESGKARGETSMDAWESRHLALGQDPRSLQPEATPAASPRRDRINLRAFAAPRQQLTPAPIQVDEREKAIFQETAFADAVAIYLLSLAMDIDYSELRERDYPLLAPAALADRLRLIAELFPPNPGYEFAVRYRRRA